MPIGRILFCFWAKNQLRFKFILFSFRQKKCFQRHCILRNTAYEKVNPRRKRMFLLCWLYFQNSKKAEVWTLALDFWHVKLRSFIYQRGLKDKLSMLMSWFAFWLTKNMISWLVGYLKNHTFLQWWMFSLAKCFSMAWINHICPRNPCYSCKTDITFDVPILDIDQVHDLFIWLLLELINLLLYFSYTNLFLLKAWVLA